MLEFVFSFLTLFSSDIFLTQALHAKYVIQLLIEVRRILKTQANIRYASTSISKQITVCGDIHGKLGDLYMIFHKVSIQIYIQNRKRTCEKIVKIVRHMGYMVAHF